MSCLYSIFYIALISQSLATRRFAKSEDEPAFIEVFDLTYPTTWKSVSEYYTSVEKHWKVCTNCGLPQLGTGIHLENIEAHSSVHPANLPTEYLHTRLTIIDLAPLTLRDPSLVVTVDIANQWSSLKWDPIEPTMLLFRFGWRDRPVKDETKKISCLSCKSPGLSYELAEWIAGNLSHVVGVATDAPTLESEQTREFNSRTIANVLGRSGIYMIENVNYNKRLPKVGCLAITMPWKMLHVNFVPCRLTALCPTGGAQDSHVVVALRKVSYRNSYSKTSDIELEELLN